MESSMNRHEQYLKDDEAAFLKMRAVPFEQESSMNRSYMYVSLVVSTYLKMKKMKKQYRCHFC
jgi:hypothetical protein